MHTSERSSASSVRYKACPRWRQSSITTLVMLGILCGGFIGTADGRLVKESSCKVRMDGRIIDLSSLARTDGTPRFAVQNNDRTFFFNPCQSFNLPKEDPYSGDGDRCLFVMMCLSQNASNVISRYSVALEKSAKFVYLDYSPLNTKQKLNDMKQDTNVKEIDPGSINDDVIHEQAGNKTDNENDDDDKRVPEQDQDDKGNKEEDVEKEEEDMHDEKEDMDEEGEEDVNDEIKDDMDEEEEDDMDDKEEDDMDDEEEDDMDDMDNMDDMDDEEEDKMDEAKEDEMDETEEDEMDEKEEAEMDEEEEADDEGDGEQKIVPVQTITVNARNKTLSAEKQRRKAERRARKNKLKKRERRSQSVPLSDKDTAKTVNKKASGRLAIRFKGIKTYKDQKSYIILTCDTALRRADQAQFKMLESTEKATYYFELRHLCCCPGACEGLQTPLIIPGNTVSSTTHPSNDSVQILEIPVSNGPGPQHMWIIILVNVGILALAIFIAAVCCRRGSSSAGEGTYYSYLPALQHFRESAIHGSQYTIHSADGFHTSNPKLSSGLTPDQLDYSSSLHINNAKLAMPNGVLIPSIELEVGQRLGGGLYCDTYLTNWKKRQVVAKRITVGVHQNQLNEEDFQWVLKEVSHLGKQRHKALVSVFGLCNDGKQPYVVHEFLDGESLKDVLKKQDDTQFLTWQEKLKLLMQIADGMAYLHSAKRPVLHRDLRCSNVMVNRSGKVKIVDYGMTRIVQRLRMSCNGRKGCYCRRESSAFPASIRWTPPEILENPQADETSGIFSPACDVYSFAMVMWEMAIAGDPFEEVIDEGDVLEIVRSGGRPRMETVGGWIPQYRELMRACWDQHSENRPNIKQVAVHLKTILHLTGSMKTQRPRTRNDSSTTSYLRSALNFPEV